MSRTSPKTRVILFSLAMSLLLVVVVYKRSTEPEPIQPTLVQVEEEEFVEPIEEPRLATCNDIDFECIVSCYDRGCVRQCLKPACFDCLKNFGPSLSPGRDDPADCTQMFGLSRDASFSAGAWERISNPAQFTRDAIGDRPMIDWGESKVDVTVYDLGPACNPELQRSGDVYYIRDGTKALALASRGFGSNIRWSRSENYFLFYIPGDRVILMDGSTGLTISEKRVEGFSHAQISADESYIDLKQPDFNQRIRISSWDVVDAKTPLDIRPGAPLTPKCPNLETLSVFGDEVFVLNETTRGSIAIDIVNDVAVAKRYARPSVRKQKTPADSGMRSAKGKVIKNKVAMPYATPRNYHHYSFVLDPVFWDNRQSVYFLGNRMALMHQSFSGKRYLRRLERGGRFLRASSDGEYLLFVKQWKNRTSFLWFVDEPTPGQLIEFSTSLRLEDIDMGEPGVFYILDQGRVYRIERANEFTQTVVPITHIEGIDSILSRWPLVDPSEPPAEPTIVIHE